MVGNGCIPGLIPGDAETLTIRVPPSKLGLSRPLVGLFLLDGLSGRLLSASPPLPSARATSHPHHGLSHPWCESGSALPGGLRGPSCPPGVRQSHMRSPLGLALLKKLLQALGQKDCWAGRWEEAVAGSTVGREKGRGRRPHPQTLGPKRTADLQHTHGAPCWTALSSRADTFQ